MLKCVACTKQMGEAERDDRGEGGGGRTPSTKEAVKSLTTQIKDMAIKFSCSYKPRKPYTGSVMYKKEHIPYSGIDMSESNRIPHPFNGGGSSSSTPTWNSTSNVGISRVLSIQSPSRASNMVIEDENEPMEWMAQVEPGVHITFISLPNGGNDLKRIRFSREMFNKWEAQRWWGENYDRIMELYNVHRFNQHTPPWSEEARDSVCSKIGSATGGPMDYHGGSNHFNGGASGQRVVEPRSPDNASVSISNASDVESEWVEEDEPGVYITIRQLVDGTRELRRVRFSRENFGEVMAKQWWEENRERVQAQYL